MFARLANLFATSDRPSAAKGLSAGRTNRSAGITGLNRNALNTMQQPLDRARIAASVLAFPSGQALPVLLRA